MESKDHPIKIYSVCEALQMYAVPHYGEYVYNIIFPSSCKRIDINDIPQNIRASSKIDTANYNEIDVLSIVYDGSTFCASKSERNFKQRLNVITHPYVFYKAKIGETHETKIQLGIFPLTNLTPMEEAHDTYNQVLFNPVDILSSEPHTVCIHPNINENNECISPNNAKFDIFMWEPMISFYLVGVVKYFDYKRLFVVHSNIILSPYIHLMRGLGPFLFKEYSMKVYPEQKTFDDSSKIIGLPLALSKVIECIKAVFGLHMSEAINSDPNYLAYHQLCTKLYNIGLTLFTSATDYKTIDKAAISIADGFTKYFSYFMWRAFNCPIIEKFGDSIIDTASINQKLHYVKHFMNEIINELSYSINSIIKAYKFDSKSIDPVYKECIELTVNTTIVSQDKNGEAQAQYLFRTNINELPKFRFYGLPIYLDGLINEISEASIAESMCLALENKSDWTITLNSLREILRTYIYYSAWVEMGKPNVHSNFGYCTLVQTEIDPKFYMPGQMKQSLFRKFAATLKKIEGK